jgi:WD40 repeat protein
MAVDTEGTILFTGSMDKTVRSWDISLGRCLKVFEGHENGILSMHVSKTMLFTGSADGTAKSWVIEFGECTRTFKGHQHSITCMTYAGGLRKID